MLYAPLPVYFLLLGCALCAPERVPEHEEPARAHAALDLDKRATRDGLDKRAYSYVSEYKRLPVYNFGLGKRSRLYSFGLGKRSVDEDSAEEYGNEDQALAELIDQYEDSPVYEEKRARPYSFGLGKRFSDDESEEKRARMYDFGLGKRLPLYNFGLGKRARSYNFGLGKRLSSKFNFGLGKRQRDMHRFNFGLGKRSGDDAPLDDSDNYFEV